jgi:zinc protease
MWKRVMVLAVVAACARTTPQILFKYGETRGRLHKNGLRFVVMPDATTQLLEVDVRYEVGSREDPPGKAGLAHLVEHLMFVQRPDGPGTLTIMQALQQATLDVNAYTNWDSTHYLTSARPELLDSLVKIEAIRMQAGCTTLTEDEFLREREVVRNEIRTRSRTPEDKIPQLALAKIYPPDHAYARMVGGDDEQIASITLADACEFMRKYYVPERAIVIVAGGVELQPAIASIEKWFNVLDRRAPAPRRVVERVPARKERSTIELDLERPWVTVAWPLPDARTPEGEAAQVGVWRAFIDARAKGDEYECATQGFPTLLGGREAPVFLIALELKSMSKLDECVDFVFKAARNASQGWDGGLWSQIEELRHTRQALFIAGLEPLFARANEVGDLVQFSTDVDFDSRELYVFHELDKLGKLDLARVGKSLSRALDPQAAKVVVFKPTKESGRGDHRSSVTFETRSDDDRDLGEVSPEEAERPLHLGIDLKSVAGATRFTLGNGMRVVLLPVEAMPVVAAELVFDAGEASAPNNPALAWAAANFLSLPPDATILGETGIRLDCDTTADHTICRARGMAIYTDVVIEAFERLIKVGAYSQLEVEQWQRSMRDSYKLKRSQQRLEFERQQLAAIYGPDHPYTRTGVVLPEAIGKVGRDALYSFRDHHYTAANATLVIAGAFDAKRAADKIRHVFGDLRSGSRQPPVPPVAAHSGGPRYVGVVGSEDSQVDIAILYPSPPGIAGQEAARLILTAMLDDRVGVVRSKLGATYGTYARRDARLGASMYKLGGAVDSARAGEALAAMRDGVAAMRAGADFNASFVRARHRVIQHLLGESTVSAQLADELATIARFGLDPSYYAGLLKQVEVVSPAQVAALVTRELDPANEVVVALGDRAALAKAFADAGLSTVTFVEPSYR